MLCAGNVCWPLLCVLQVTAVVIFALGFFTKGLRSPATNGTTQELRGFEGCPKSLVKKPSAEGPGSTKMVIVLIDAWQEQFFFNRQEMRFLRQITLDGAALAFTAHVQTPTVTMPRIKALTAGVVPSFADIVLNFATTSISNDNIIDQLKGNGYRLTFCGDETWLQLFPGRFDNHSVGTASFYVNDYKELNGRSVTRRVSIVFWDLRKKQ
ncbi:unnamed protein product [Gongylonema pulchrum]|uniref:Sulfatase domain-containing protein n=1 Tax=Gongylonema pulchrum TaxID=637853 RepID=A0A183DZG3_9BILA|nr:unnamed protein product [Gongylonema pulchrum]